MSTITRETIRETHRRIAGHVRLTPVISVDVPGVELPVTLKLELLQHSGSFKARGAFANLLNESVPGAGVTAASGGNHGAAVAFAAHRLGVPARIFVPEISSPAKIGRIRAYGAEVVVDGANYAAALANCEGYAAGAGARAVHAYDAAATLNGQGTLALELEDQAPDLDSLLVAVGGGGLIGGIAAWYGDRTRLIAVEPEGCPTLNASLAAGERVQVDPRGIAADSLGASLAGELMFGIARAHVAASLLVCDDDILEAQRWLWANLQLVCEPGGAAAFAALLSGRYRARPDERVGVVMCGANANLEDFARTVATSRG